MDGQRLIPIWDERYNINNQKIDTQHKRLFELAAQVENAVFKFVKRDELKEILIELFTYMKEHFHDEEELCKAFSIRVFMNTNKCIKILSMKCLN